VVTAAAIGDTSDEATASGTSSRGGGDASRARVLVDRGAGRRQEILVVERGGDLARDHQLAAEASVRRLLTVEVDRDRGAVVGHHGVQVLAVGVRPEGVDRDDLERALDREGRRIGRAGGGDRQPCRGDDGSDEGEQHALEDLHGTIVPEIHDTVI
jgi:hypothetical protein